MRVDRGCTSVDLSVGLESGLLPVTRRFEYCDQSWRQHFLVVMHTHINTHITIFRKRAAQPYSGEFLSAGYRPHTS